MESFSAFFRAATGKAEPYPYQARLAQLEIETRILQAPTGAGKTAAAILPWLHRLTERKKDAPRRLVYCLPTRTLVEQTRDAAMRWVSAVAPNVRVATLMGGDVDLEWEMRPEESAILIGTQDMLLSRAINRGYGMSRFRWPVHFGLLNNDALWVCDEVQLMGDGLATTAQLEAFRTKFSTFGRAATLWMSATLDPDMLKTVDMRDVPPVLSLSDEDRDRLRDRLHAEKRLERAPRECRTPPGLARFVAAHHRPGTQTLVIVNRVARARETWEELRRLGKPSHLLHSRFRPHEKRAWSGLLNADHGEEGRILVCTQVVEAGVDITSRLMVSDLAPWPSMIQRFGRCNRDGAQPGEIYWVDRPFFGKGKESDDLSEELARPYEIRELEEAESRLTGLTSAAPADLPVHRMPYRPNHVLRRRDLIDLFDTTADLSGYDPDVSRFVRDDSSADVQIAWRCHLPEESQKHAAPARDELCTAPISEVKPLIEESGKKKARMDARIWNALESKWEKPDAGKLVPGSILLASALSGCYATDRGWDPGVTKGVVPVETAPRTEEGNGDDPGAFQRYKQTLAAHSREVEGAMDHLLGMLGDLGLEPHHGSLRVAALGHDRGKAHDVFQQTLRSAGGPLLAKSTGGGRHRRRSFRHELASALALLSEGAPDLAVYLAAAHHGKVRLSIRAWPGEAEEIESKQIALFARGIFQGDRLPGVDELGWTEVELDLTVMQLGRVNGPSWIERMVRLRDSLGPFRLAYLEALIVAADVRATANPKEILA